MKATLKVAIKKLAIVRRNAPKAGKVINVLQQCAGKINVDGMVNV